MIIDNQLEVINALLNPNFYPKEWGIKKVEIKHSHMALIFLVGDYVFKLKRAVVYPELDFSTPAKRRLACVQEMKRSAIYAPLLVINVQSIRKLETGEICLGGKDGQELDSVICMHRIQEKSILSNLIADESFGRFEMMDLAESLASLYQKSKTFRSKWSAKTVQKLILENEANLSSFASEYIDKGVLNQLTAKSLSILSQNESLIAIRQKGGLVRKCHGELLLSNIAYENNQFIFFSPIEYDETLGCVDTLYDFSFLLMDLEHRKLRRLSNILFNHYMAKMNDIHGVALLSLYQSMQAGRRASSCAKKISLLSGKEKEQAIKDTQSYFQLSCEFLTASPAVLIACGGFSGSGKSRIAREIGGMINPAPGAVILRDDIVKKQFNGGDSESGFNHGVYDSPAVEKIVYAVLRQQAKIALESHSCVIVDALFYDENERQMIEGLASKLNVPFLGIWIDAPFDTRLERVQSRKRNPSMVKTSVQLEQQLSLKTGTVNWQIIMTDQPKIETLNQAVEIVKSFNAPILNKN